MRFVNEITELTLLHFTKQHKYKNTLDLVEQLFLLMKCLLLSFLFRVMQIAQEFQVTADNS